MPKKILVVNMNYMGDALLTTPALAALRRAYPDAKIDTVVGAGAAVEVLRGNPDLNTVIARTARGSGGRVMQTFRLLREGRYSDAIILPPLPAYAAAAWLARTPVRVGQANRGMNKFLTHLRHTRATHMADAMLDTVPVPEFARPEARRLAVFVDDAARATARALLREANIDAGRPLLAVNVGATRPQKRWFAEAFALTLDQLADVAVVLVGAGENDDALAASVMASVRYAQPVNLVGRTDVKQLAALLERADVLLSADSGPMHLATAVGTPTVALFGSTDPDATGPYDELSQVLYKNLACAPCGNHPTCGERYDCLRAITPDEVALSIRSLLRQRRGESFSPLPLASVPLDVRLENLSPRPPSFQGGGAKDLPVLPLLPGGKGAGGIGLRAGSKRILIATKFRFIGDTLLAIPIFRAARAQWPDAHIALLTGRNARLLLQNNPYLDEIVEFDPYKTDTGLRGYVKLVKWLRQSRFDVCLALNRSFHSALTPWLGGIKIRAGFKSEGRALLLNRRVDYDRDKSEVMCYFDVLKAVAPDAPVHPALELWLADGERQEAARRLRESLGANLDALMLVGIQPGASQDSKRWDAARFAQVADALTEDDPRTRIVLIGGPDERRASEDMAEACRETTRAQIVDFVGACDLRGSLALTSHLHLFVGNDTAVMHSAVALGIPTVALFGPTNPRKWGNYGPRHRVLESNDGTMEAIDAAAVTAAARELLAAPARQQV